MTKRAFGQLIIFTCTPIVLCALLLLKNIFARQLEFAESSRLVSPLVIILDIIYIIIAFILIHIVLTIRVERRFWQMAVSILYILIFGTAVAYIAALQVNPFLNNLLPSGYFTTIYLVYGKGTLTSAVVLAATYIVRLTKSIF